MWSKKDKEKKTIVNKTETRQVTQTSQTLSVRTTYEQRSVSTNVPGTFRDLTPSSSLSRIDNKNYLALPPSTTTRSPSASNLSNFSVDARPVSTNLNYQSPFRNSPAYRSIQNYPNFQKNSSLITTRPSTTYHRELPSTVQPIRPVGTASKKIIVKKTGKFYDQTCPVPTYQTHGKNRGEVLIVNNIMFKDKGERHGAKVDDENLKTLFKEMGFKVAVERDLKKTAMINKVKSFSKKSSLFTADIAIVVVMSHGTKNTTLGGTEVFGLDEAGVLVDDLIECFNEAECKHLADKPKIFIFQCCRGDNEQFIESDAQRTPQGKPALVNTLIAYSTLPGYVSHRDPTYGTWYIKTLCDVFSQHAHEYHVEDLLKMVDVQLGSLAKNVKQTTNYENRGFKRCYLHPQ